jgi:hypothetical protein
MYFSYFFTALLFALLAILGISAVSKRPLRGLWVVFFIVLLVTWASQLWINPFGPVFWGVAVFPPFLVAVFIALLILALMPVPADSTFRPSTDDAPLIAFGFFFWMLLILLLISVIAGYYRVYSVTIPSP